MPVYQPQRVGPVPQAGGEVIAVTSPLGLAITAGACWRLVKLATSDAILDRPRNATKKHPHLFLFLCCPWCLGVWIAGGVVALDELCWSWWAWVASVLALSAVAAFMTEKS
jgi:hypothetical protein